MPSEVFIDSRQPHISHWWETLCARVGIHQVRCEVHEHRALITERASKTIISMPRKDLGNDNNVNLRKIFFELLRRYHNIGLCHC